MKHKLIRMTLATFLALTCVGCGTEAPRELEAENWVDAETPEHVETAEGVETALVDETPMEETAPTEVQEETVGKTDTQEPTETSDFSFADLSKRAFECSWGSGGWSEEFTIEKDGYFTGRYSGWGSDEEVGEDYEATMYKNSYSGHFTDLTKINDYTYQMKLADISYKMEPDRITFSDNIRYIYTESYCFREGKAYTVYLPGTPLSELEEVKLWFSGMNESETELTMVMLVEANNECAAYSRDRLAPLEEAQQCYENCLESCEYYDEKIGETSITMHWVEYTGTQYGISDECLNYIWNLIRYNVDEDKYQEILAEQREWIAEKEAAADEAAAEFGSGSFSTVAYNDVLGQKTLERCKELIEYLK